MKTKITKTLLKSLAPQDKPYEIKDTELTGFHIRVYPTGKISYYYAYINAQHRRHRILMGNAKTLTVQQARDAVTRYAAEVANGVDVHKEKKIQRQQHDAVNRMTLAHFLDKHYEQWILSHTKSGDATLQVIRSTFKTYLSWSLMDFTLEMMEKWRTQQTQKGLKPGSINRQTGALSGAMTRAEKWKLIPQHPFRGLAKLKEDKKPVVRYLTKEEYQRLMTALSGRDQALKEARQRENTRRQAREQPPLPGLMTHTFADKMTPMVILSLKTGLRRGEVFDLKWHHIDFEQRQIVVMGDTAKTGQTRYIPMSNLVYDTLKAWQAQAPQPEGRVFPANDGGRLNRITIYWEDILKRAQITRFRWHDMRHDFASQLVMRGVPLNTVRELCGHAKFETTLRYANLSASHKADAVALLDDV